MDKDMDKCFICKIASDEEITLSEAVVEIDPDDADRYELTVNLCDDCQETEFVVRRYDVVTVLS